MLAQSPGAGTKVQSGTTVISDGAQSGVQYDLESVNGETQYAAGAALDDPRINGVGSDADVLEHGESGPGDWDDPPAGSLVKEGEAIQLELSSGPCNVVMPSVSTTPKPKRTLR